MYNTILIASISQGPRATAPKPRQLNTVKPAASTAGGAALLNPDPRLQDSVENSFREKLSVQVRRSRVVKYSYFLDMLCLNRINETKTQTLDILILFS